MIADDTGANLPEPDRSVSFNATFSMLPRIKGTSDGSLLKIPKHLKCLNAAAYLTEP